MLYFYRHNLKYFFRILRIRLLIYLAVILPLCVPLAALLILFFKINRDVFNIAVLSAAAFFILVILGFAGVFVVGFIYITGYSLAKENQDSYRFGQKVTTLYGRLVSLKFLLTGLLITLTCIAIGSLVYLHVVPSSLAPYISTKIGLTLGIYLLLLILLRIIIPRVWRLFRKSVTVVPGISWKMLLVLLMILSQVAILAAIYFAVSFVLYRNYGIPM